ncbi:MAG: c-type cytochrome biogenesis protein CcsB [Oscillospiraceae bacterium]|nr:c-type cytochrome biogenesis protein CcsB [Oscillospiraceae bacterium]MBQ9664659.1 c-type cytochrome biogenesis protein CcsB [Oscillospiraceae bacterium]
MDILFFGSLVVYFIAMGIQFAALAFKKEAIVKAAWIAFLVAFAGHTVYLVWRGITAGRLPLSNQFEFATAFAWGVALMLLILRSRMKADWLNVVAMPMVFLILSYAALQPREISDLMPALRSGWFAFHISSAVISYSAFVIAGCAGLRYILLSKKGQSGNETKLRQMDWMGYRLVALGVLMLTITILTGAFWAEQAWGAFWTWDPKEVWALITWIIYIVYLHLRLRSKKQGIGMAWYLVISVPVVLFTFAGVNTLMSGLHSYG